MRAERRVATGGDGRRSSAVMVPVCEVHAACAVGVRRQSLHFPLFHCSQACIQLLPCAARYYMSVSN